MKTLIPALSYKGEFQLSVEEERSYIYKLLCKEVIYFISLIYKE